MSRKLVYSTQCASGCAKSRKSNLSILAKLRERTSRIHVSHRDKYDEVKKQFCRSFIRICIVLFTWLYSTETVQGIRIDCYSRIHVSHRDKYDEVKKQFCRSFIRICIVLFTWLYSTETVQGIRIDCYSIFTVCKFNAYSDWKLKYAG